MGDEGGTQGVEVGVEGGEVGGGGRVGGGVLDAVVDGLLACAVMSCSTENLLRGGVSWVGQTCLGLCLRSLCDHGGPSGTLQHLLLLSQQRSGQMSIITHPS